MNNDGVPDIIQPDLGGNLAIFFNRGGTFLTTQSSLNPSTFGQTITFSATVSPSIAKNLTPTGTVTFYDGGVAIGSASLAGGAASLNVSTLTVGTHLITAGYSGDSNFNPHAGTPITQVVVNAVAPTTTTLTSSVNPAQLGQSVSFTATVSGGLSPTGSVTLKDGATVLATVALTGNQAVYITSALAAGSHVITAVYSGDTANASSTSATLYQNIVPAAPPGAILFGLVTNSNTGQPIAGAAVTLYGPTLLTVNTDTNGNYFVTGQQWPYLGSAEMWIVAPGYFTPVLSVNIATPFPVTLNRALIPGGPVVRGTVTDASTSQPIANANVLYSSGSFYPGAGTRAAQTDTAGNYSIDSSQFNESIATTGTQVSLTVSNSGYLQSTASVQAAPPYPTLQNFALTPATTTLLRGTVTDQATRQPISGAAVTLYGPTLLTVNTDSSGNYSITGQQWPYTGNAEMWIVAPGYFTPVLSVNIATPFPVIMNRALIPGGPVVRGTVTDASTSQPIANANVLYSSGSFYPGAGTRAVQTDTAGNYSIDSSQFNESIATTGTQVSLTVSNSGYLQSTASVQAAPPYPTLQNFALTPATATLLQGTVTDQSTGKPISNAAVTLYGPSLITINTDASGNYAFTGQQWPYLGSAEMWIVAPGYFTPVLSVNIATPFPVTMNRALIPGGPIVRGSVTDANSNLPIANANVLYSSGAFYPGAGTRAVQTDTAGNYTIDSSQFNESIATTSAQISLTVSSQPGYFQISSSATAMPPYPLMQNFALTPTGATAAVTVATNPASLGIVVDGTSYVAPQVFTWVPGNPHTIAVASPQSGAPGTQYAFAAWSNGGPISQTVVAPASSSTYTASFNTQYLLTTSATPTAGGTVTAGGYFNAGSPVKVTATANSGYTFAGFSGDLTGTTNPQTLVMNGPKTVTASFAPSIVTTTTSITAPVVSYGTAASVTVSVTAAQGTATGNVSMTVDNAAPLTQSLSNGSTTFSISGLAVGSHNLSASFAAQGNFGASSATGALQVNQATTTVSISNIPGSAVFGGSFTLAYAYTGDGTPSVTSSTSATCAVSGSIVNFVAAGACMLTARATAGTNYAATTGSPQSFTIAQATPTLSINNIPSNAVFGGSFTPTFAYNGDGIPSVTSSTATCAVSSGLVRFVGAGTCTLTARSTAGTNYAAATGAPQSFTIAQAATAISVNNIPSTAVFGSGFNATYSYIGDGIPSTTSSTPSTCAVSGSAVSFVGAGTCTLVARATAGTNYAATTGSPQSFAIAKATSTTTIVSSQNPQIVNQPITFTATLASQFTGAVTGSVVFKNGATTLGTVPLSGSQATFTTSFSATGTRSITAQYTGDVNNLGGTSPALSQSVVAKFATTTTLVSSLNPSFVGQLVTLTATVTSAGGAPPNGEVITFKQGTTTLATAPLSGGSASFTTSALAAGTHTITASYGGDATFAASTSSGLKQVVNKYPTTTSLTSSLNPSTFGQSVTFTAAVTSAGPSAPTGNVTFRNGSTTLATVALNASGVATLTRSNLPAGTLSITATYNGDTQSATSSASLSQAINMAVTSTTVTSSRNPSTFGQSVTFTATVTSPTITPTGTVTFTSGSTTLGTVTLSSGKASLSTKTLPRGANSIKATYNGTANITGSSASLAQQVN